MNTGVYEILNTVNGKRYVGSSVNMVRRLKEHRYRLGRGEHHSQKLQRAWEKYGSTVFTFKALFICPKNMLTFYEQRALDGFASVAEGYNVLPFARSGAGRKVSPEALAKMRAYQSNRTPEHRANIAAALTGKRLSEATKRKVGAASKGRKHTEATKAVIADAGRNMSVESRQRISDALRARVCSDATREKLAKAQTGREYSEESKAKMRASRLAYLQKSQSNPTEKGNDNG